MAINEIQRQAYLDAMGVKSYFPRFKLPGAKVSVQCQWPQEVKVLEDPQSKSRIEIGKEENKPAVVKSEEIIKQENKNNIPKESLTNHASNPKDLADSTKIQNTSADSADEIRFQLAFIRVDQNICVLNQLPYMNSKHLSALHQSLFLNIVMALKLSQEAVQFDQLPFRWPFSEAEYIEKNETAARQALHAYLGQRMLEKKFTTLVVMGEMAAKFILPEAINNIESGELNSIEGLPWKIIAVKSLDEMQKIPSLKRGVWKVLSSLQQPNNE